MSSKFHNDLIRLIVKYPQALEEMIEFPIGEIRTNHHFHYSRTENLELDIYIIYGNKKAIIEVKSFYEQKDYFLEKQYPRYIEKFPNAKLFFMYPILPNWLHPLNIGYEEIVRIKH